MAQYGVLDITDTGGTTILVRFTGKRVGEGAKLNFQFTAASTGIVPNAGPGVDADLGHAFVNISTRGRIVSASDSLIAGFVIAGTTARTILLRAVGPSLAVFGVSDALPRPVLQLFRGTNIVASNDDWTIADPVRLAAAFDRVGAFRFASTTSRDAAMLVTLAPGAYTMQAKSGTGVAGSVLVEAYEVP